VSSGACNRHDIEVLVSFMSEDGIFATAGGTDAYGTRRQGAAAVRKAFATAWQAVSDLPLVYPNVLAPARSLLFAPFRRLGQRVLCR
jgi:hypothetical protein